MNHDENQILGTVETIASGSVRGGPSHNAQKQHMRTVMTIEAKRRRERYEPICFIEEDFGNIDRAHDDPMVISALVHNFLVKRVLVDQGSSADILYSYVAKALGIHKDAYNTYAGALIGFTRG